MPLNATHCACKYIILQTTLFKQNKFTGIKAKKRAQMIAHEENPHTFASTIKKNRIIER
jgi:hypothetical protein